MFKYTVEVVFRLIAQLRAEGFKISPETEALHLQMGLPPMAGGDGTVLTPRATGVDMDESTNLEFSLRVRYVDDMLAVLSDYDVFLLKRVGGIDQFTVRNVKHEWVEDDIWARRFLVAEALDNSETAVDVPTGTGHRYPKGTLLKVDDEVMLVTAFAASVLTVIRGAAGTTAATHLISAEVLIVGYAIQEGAARSLRGTNIYTMPFNYCQIGRQAVGVTYRQQEIDVYGRSGPDLDEKMGNAMKQMMVGLEEGLFEGNRHPGTVTTDDAGTFGGLDFYFNTTNDANANVVDLNSAAITETTLLDLLQTIFYKVGASNMGRVLLTGAWTKRKINEFWRAGVRQQRAENTIGQIINNIETDFGTIEVFMHTAVPKTKAFLLNPAFVEVGHFGKLGRMHSRDLPVTNDTFEREIYGDYTTRIKNVAAQGKIQEISLTT